MINTDSNKQINMDNLAPDIRVQTFSEVATGYTPQQAKAEAMRCLNCKNAPCVQGCPVAVKIPEFIEAIKNDDNQKAREIIEQTNLLGDICGRVCPQERQCQSKCVRGIKGDSIAIGRLERFAFDVTAPNSTAPDSTADFTTPEPDAKGEHATNPQLNTKKVAIVGSGPAGLSCAATLAQAGIKVDVYEALHDFGGVLLYGIPNFRLPKNIVANFIDNLKSKGVRLYNNVVVGKTIKLSKIYTDYDATFIGAGAGLPRFQGIPGEQLSGVYSANEFLTRINLMHANRFPTFDTPVLIGDNVAIIGGGNVAMDAARCAIRSGAKHVTILYRRTEAEMPARAEEIEHAKEEGIEFKLLVNPLQIIGDDNGFVKSIELLKMQLGEPDSSGRRAPEPIPNSNFSLDVQTVVVAIGQTPNPLIRRQADHEQIPLNFNTKGCIVANEDDFETSIDNVYAGGDIVTGAATIILAMGAGRKAALSMIDKFKTHKQG